MKANSKSVILPLVVIVCCTCCKGSFQAELSKIPQITHMPYFPELTGDSLFWELSKKKLKIVPALIAGISDTTRTKATVLNFGGVYTVGDVCVRLIEEIIQDFPTTRLIETDKLVLQKEGYGVYWRYVRKSHENRISLEENARRWFNQNKRNLVWVNDERLYATSDNEDSKLSRRPAGGFYTLKVETERSQR